MSSDRQWHIECNRQILQDYPEIKQYFGNYLLSLIFIIALVIFQWFLARLVQDLTWWQIGSNVFYFFML